ncbi:unnamed protein product [Mytilus edulis]|uniref:Fibronectin type-III domain-containing protein n=1 Tax=Mytilus edulis TaxID=6550 RepID=A0A8S3Q8R4_MYTED|nr:unnamed protein product [Mytilus edulis]
MDCDILSITEKTGELSLGENSYTSTIKRPRKLVDAHENSVQQVEDMREPPLFSTDKPIIKFQDLNSVEVSWKAPTPRSSDTFAITYDVQMKSEIDSTILPTRIGQTCCTIDELTAEVNYLLRISTRSKMDKIESVTDPINFKLPLVEMLEDIDSEEWVPITTNLVHTSFWFEDKYLSTDCLFRVIAETDVGKSLPTDPVILTRPSGRSNIKIKDSL